MNLKTWRAERQNEKLRRRIRATDPFVDHELMRLAFLPLSETTITLDDLSICFGCGQLFLTSMEGKHLAHHDWVHQTNPLAIARPVRLEV
jgi:hypothetical protein